MVLDPTDLDTRFVNEADHTKAAHDALGLSHDSLSDITIIGAQIEELAMFGSDNAEWIPCVFVGGNQRKFSYVSPHFRNIDDTDEAIGFVLPLPTTRGSLKLHVTGLKVVVYAADANDYVDHAYLFANDYDTQTILINDGTNRTAQDEYEYPLEDTDVSGYTDIVVTLACVLTDAGGLRLCSPLVQCFYAA